MYLKYETSLKEDRDVPKIAMIDIFSQFYFPWISLDLQSTFRLSAEQDNLRL